MNSKKITKIANIQENIFIQTQFNVFYWFYLCSFVSFVGYCLIRDYFYWYSFV